MRSVFGRALNQYFSASATVSRYVGGMNYRRDHVGDPGARLPFEPVPAAKQREALDFLSRRIFAPNSIRVPASLAASLAPERMTDFDWTASYAPRVDFPIHDVIRAAQSVALNRLYHPITLNRLVDLPLYYTSGEKPFTMVEMFDGVRGAIWSEVGTGNVGTSRRNLQRAHLDRLIALVVDPPAAPYFTPEGGRDPAGKVEAPEDARSFARADLTRLDRDLRGALAGAALDRSTRAHFEECRARIGAALEAGLDRKG
jgi:hypothetical protein